MRVLAAVLALGCLLGAPRGAAGQDAQPPAEEVPSPPDIPPGEDHIYSMDLGAAARARGMLLDTDTAVRWTNRLRWWPEMYRLQLRLHNAEVVAIRASHDREMTLVRESYTRELDGARGDMRTQAEAFTRSQDRPFYDTFAFGLVLGVLIAGVLVGLVAWAIASG